MDREIQIPSVRVTTTVPHGADEVFDLLATLRGRERITGHFLRNWERCGPDRGVGARATARVMPGGRVDVELVTARAPARVVERQARANGRRLALATYMLTPLSDGSTRIGFEYAWLRAPRRDRLMAALVRRRLRRAYRRALKRLAALLDAEAARASPAGRVEPR
jgi:hypothetical protein